MATYTSSSLTEQRRRKLWARPAANECVHALLWESLLVDYAAESETAATALWAVGGPSVSLIFGEGKASEAKRGESQRGNADPARLPRAETRYLKTPALIAA